MGSDPCVPLLPQGGHRGLGCASHSGHSWEVKPSPPKTEFICPVFDGPLSPKRVLFLSNACSPPDEALRDRREMRLSRTLRALQV